jgi:hypothetical protein
MAITHRGAFDESAVADIIQTDGSQITTSTLAGPATFPANAITGADDVFYLSTAVTPGSLTTRTAAQMYADLQALIGIQNLNGFQYTLRVVNTVITNTLTLVAGTGVTFGGAGVNTVAPTSFRDYVVVVVNAGAITMTSTGTGTWS